jgi:hypothetical protein
MVRRWGGEPWCIQGDMTMPRNKDLKRLVRARMRKTGEAYTAARANIVRKSESIAPSQFDFAALAGMSDASVKEKTGCTWERWVHALDRLKADKMSHGEIAELVKTKYKIDSWWSQTVTVGYERIKGLRARGQQRDGSYEATKSRTFDVPVTKLFNAWAKAPVRRRWLDGASVKVRTATAPKSIRLDWIDGSIIAVGFVAKTKTKSSVAVAHTKLPDKESATRVKQYWGERLDALGEVLAER